jgi:hypothetical protein
VNLTELNAGAHQYDGGDGDALREQLDPPSEEDLDHERDDALQKRSSGSSGQ